MDGKTPIENMTDRDIAVENLQTLRRLESLLDEYHPLLEEFKAKRESFVGRVVFGGR